MEGEDSGEDETRFRRESDGSGYLIGEIDSESSEEDGENPNEGESNEDALIRKKSFYLSGSLVIERCGSGYIRFGIVVVWPPNSRVYF